MGGMAAITVLFGKLHCINNTHMGDKQKNNVLIVPMRHSWVGNVSGNDVMSLVVYVWRHSWYKYGITSNISECFPCNSAMGAQMKNYGLFHKWTSQKVQGGFWGLFKGMGWVFSGPFRGGTALLCSCMVSLIPNIRLNCAINFWIFRKNRKPWS